MIPHTEAERQALRHSAGESRARYTKNATSADEGDIDVVKVRATFLSRDVLSRGLTALHDGGIKDDQVEIREQRPRTGEPGFEYVDEQDRGAQVRMTGDVDHTMAATGDTLLGSTAVPTTDTRLGDLLAAMAEREGGEERPEYEAGTRYEVTVETDDPEKVRALLDDNGGRSVKVMENP